MVKRCADRGPINPVLYCTLGPAGVRDGIVDVIGGNDSVTLPSGTVVPGFTAVAGFDVASGWATISAPAFVPALMGATKAGLRKQPRVRRPERS